MGFWGELFGLDDAQAQNEVIYETEYTPEHQASFTHEGSLHFAVWATRDT
jgi:hypothetical protein